MAKFKQMGREARRSRSSGTEVKDVCSFTSIPIYTFKVRCLSKHEEKFSLDICLSVMEKDKLMPEFNSFKKQDSHPEQFTSLYRYDP